MKLYSERNPAPNPRRVRIFLMEKGISIPTEDVSLRERQHKTPEFKHKNSLGQVPVLEVDEHTHLSESISICRYLEELHPTPPLFGSNALDRARVDMWIRRVEFSLMNPIAMVWIHTHRYTAHLGTQYKEFGEASKQRVASAMHWLDAELKDREFIATSSYTMADIVALTTIDFAKFVGMEMPENTPHLHAWHDRVTARPSTTA